MRYQKKLKRNSKKWVLIRKPKLESLFTNQYKR